MAGYTTFKSVQSGTAPGTVEGQLPLEGSASAFQYKKDLLFYVSLGIFAGSLQKTLSGGWHIQILSSDDGPVLFEQAVTWKAIISVLGDAAFGAGIDLAVWQPGADKPEDIQTTIVNGQTIEPGTAYKYLDQSNATPLSEFGITVFDYQAQLVAGGLWLNASWLSQRYKCDIPEGAVLRIIEDNWGIGSLRNDATYQFSFKAATPVLDCFWDVAGGLHIALPVSGNIEIHHRYIEGSIVPSESRAIIQGVTTPSLFKDDADRLYLAGIDSEGNYRLYETLNNGLSFSKLPDTTGLIFQHGYTFPFCRYVSGGTMAAIGVQAGKIWYRSGRGEGFGYSGLVGDATTGHTYHLLELPGVGLIITDGYSDYFLSQDKGVTWARREITIWASSYQRAYTTNAGDEAYSIAAQGGKLYIKTSRDGWLHETIIGSISGARSYRLLCRSLGNSLIVTDGLNDLFISNDAGVSWGKVDES